MTNQTGRLIRAPWTAEQVAALNAFQQRGGMHPFTCGGDHTPGSPVLVAQEDGWHCPEPYGEPCDYRQDWAHAFMVERGAAVQPPVREQLLNGLDATYCQTLGYGTPEELLAAYDADRTPADRAALRTRFADALAKADGWVWAEGFDKMQSPAYQGFLRQADAVLAVLPATTDQTAVPSAVVRKTLRRWAYAGGHIESELDGAVDRMYALVERDVLRRMADETPAAETHACANCEGVDPDTCLNNPHRPPEQCPRSEADGYGLQCQKPAGHNLCTFEEQPAAGARQDGTV